MNSAAKVVLIRAAASTQPFGILPNSMVKYYRQIFSLLGLILALSASGNSQTDIAGWRAARWGMSDSDILGTFGTQLKTLSKPQRFREQHVDLIIPDFKINDHLFTVFFKMDDRTDKLIEVLIRLNEMKSRNRRDDLFSELETLLIKDYGAPGSKVNKKENPLAKYEYWDLRRIWRLPTTTVELDYLWDNSSYASVLGIKYFPTH